jgi:hypothetical protein
MSRFTFDGTENRMRWDGSSRPFMEAWYATFNHRETGAGLWLRYTITAPRFGDPICEVWGFWFDPEGKRNFGGKERYPIDRLARPNGRDDGALVRIDKAFLSENHLEGALKRGVRSLAWSLDFEPAPGCFQHLPASLRDRLEKRVSTVCAPNLSIRVSGTVTLDGEEFVFDDDHGYQGHRWGRRHPESWAWMHCSSFDEGELAVFEGLAARSSIGAIPIPTMTFLFLTLEGQEIAFNDLKWALRAHSRYEMPTWAFSAYNEDYKIAGAGRASTERLMQATYTDPDGSVRFCANSEIADLAIELYRRDGSLWRHARSLTALRTAHLEFGKSELFVELPVVV